MNKIPKEIGRALNALRFEVDGSIVDSITEIVREHTSYVEVANFGESNIPVKMNGVLIGHLQMLSVRGNLLVSPTFFPINQQDAICENKIQKQN